MHDRYIYIHTEIGCTVAKVVNERDTEYDAMIGDVLFQNVPKSMCADYTPVTENDI